MSSLITTIGSHLTARHLSRQTFGYSYSLIKRHLSTNTSNKDNDSHNYDIIINGGGIAGFSTLVALKNSSYLKNHKILLIERQIKTDNHLERKDNQFSNRVSAITKSSKRFFKKIGIWDEFKEFAKPVKEFFVWSQNYRNAINFIHDFDGEDNDDNDVVCFIVENNRMLAALQSQTNQINDSVCYETIVTDIKSDGNSVKVDTKSLKNESQSSLVTKLLIGCDGFQSTVRQKSNLVNFEHELQEMAIVATLNVSSGFGNPNNDIAFQRFVSINDSVIALLPLNQDYSSLVWSVPKDLVKQLMQMNENKFVEHLNDCLKTENSNSSSIVSKFDGIIDSIFPKSMISNENVSYSVPQINSVVTDSRVAFPLKLSTTLPYFVGSPNDSKDNNRIVLLGDAAHRIHPLAGQGLNLGIGDVYVLTQTIESYLSRGECLFGQNPLDCSKRLESCLFDFESKRQFKSIAMISAVHSMKQLFNLIPSNVLSVMNSANFVKKQIVKFANSV
ncbi:ubiquinone biosynthesis monooxygenase COQ6, mitochondrial-like [Oppia nitens]|uniref:ubiquinone biosynthesis monooxygenase COQ6, mitochondrial-like n=1 Tax=Oppia nitens TaxID=1686743 RepID=UPI0023DC640C|nr:ubiquinone biosynthesis monooxygenase COQ6, mitochondrial-like [Oppia nitens]